MARPSNGWREEWWWEQQAVCHQKKCRHSVLCTGRDVEQHRNLHSNVDLYFNKIFVGINFYGFCKTQSFKNPYKIKRKVLIFVYFLQTLVSSEPPSTGRPCFKWTVKELLQLALIEDIVSGAPSNSKVWYIFTYSVNCYKVV